MNNNRFQDKPAILYQKVCSHKLLNRAGDECSACGSWYVDGKWKYLKKEWILYHLNGGERPKDL